MESLARRGLFCLLLLVALAGAKNLIVETHLDDEVRPVARPSRRDDVIRGARSGAGLGKLLKVRLGVGQWLLSFQTFSLRLQQA